MRFVDALGNTNHIIADFLSLCFGPEVERTTTRVQFPTL